MNETDWLLVSRLEDIAWIYNLRGRDVEHTPVFYAFALISKKEDILYVMDDSYIKRSASSVDGSAKTAVRRYAEVFKDLKQLADCTIMLDKD